MLCQRLPAHRPPTFACAAIQSTAYASTCRAVRQTQVLNLRRPADYRQQEGARFELHFEKARAVYGDGAKPLEAQLRSDENGAAVWTWKDLEESSRDRAFAMLADGMTAKDLISELGTKTSTAYRWQREYREDHGDGEG